MGKHLKNIGQLELFGSIEDTFFISKEEIRPTVIAKATEEIKTTLDVEPEYRIPPEIDPDFYPEELFLGNEELPDNIPQIQDIPMPTDSDIPEELDTEEHNIDKLIAFLNQENSRKTIKGTSPDETPPREKTDAERKAEFQEKQEDNELLDHIPFIIYETGFVDGMKTREQFSIYDSVRFYLNILDKKPGYNEFAFFLPKIKDYFIKHLQRDEDILKLRDFVREEGELRKEKDNKLMTHINGGADFLGMSLHYGKEEAINIIENMLRDNKKGDDTDNILYKAIEKKYIDTFIEQTEGLEVLNLINQNEQDIFKYFQSIHTIFHNHHIDVESIKHISDKNMWDSYKIFFKLVENCQKKINELGREQKFDFEDRFHDQYVLYMPNISEVIWDLIDYLYREDLIKIIKMAHLVPMYASFLKKGKNADLIHVFKRNIIREYIYQKTRNKNGSTNLTQNQQRLQKTAEIFANIEPIEFGPMGTARNEKITKKEADEILVRNEDPRVADLEQLFEEEGLTIDFAIDKIKAVIINRKNKQHIPISQIIEEDKDFRKISILEWANGEDLESVAIPHLPNPEGEGDFDEQILTLQNILRHDNKLSQIRFFLTEDEQYISHRLVVNDHLPIKQLFTYPESQRPSMIMDRRNKVDKDLPF